MSAVSIGGLQSGLQSIAATLGGMPMPLMSQGGAMVMASHGGAPGAMAGQMAALQAGGGLMHAGLPPGMHPGVAAPPGLMQAAGAGGLMQAGAGMQAGIHPGMHPQQMAAMAAYGGLAAPGQAAALMAYPG